MIEKIFPDEFLELAEVFIKNDDLRILSYVTADIVKAIFSGDTPEASLIRHNLNGQCSKCRGWVEMTREEDSYYEKLTEDLLTLKQTLAKALSLSVENFAPLSLATYVPVNITQKGDFYYGYSDEVVANFYRGLLHDNLIVPQETGYLFAHLKENVRKNVEDLIAQGEENLFCPAFVVEEKGEGGFFIANSGPPIPKDIFEKLGTPGLSTKITNGNSRGQGLASLAQVAKKEDCSLVAVQWDEEKTYVRDLSNNIYVEVNNGQDLLQNNPLVRMGLLAREKVLCLMNVGDNKERIKQPNIAFGICGKSNKLFIDKQAKSI